ncbi:condensation domain-containing protein [Nonomuraea sp. NPDC050547]|uniref:condensation domain-containing protein n=1 Tax=Nonomuraea sp. NPDC050547 TaxID=3364368 RepID=UPI00378A3D07
MTGRLSPTQQRLWFLQLLDPQATEYNVCVGYELDGRLDVAALRRSLSAVTDRHDALRTTFPAERGRPAARIRPPGEPLPLPLTDLSGLPDAGARAADLAAERVARPFDLARDPLFRADLIRLDPARHILLLNLHHIVADMWSVQIIFAELGALYDAEARGREAGLPLPAARYADYTAWQRDQLSGGRLDQALAYWRERLKDAPAVPDLPTDRPRSPERSPAGEELLTPVPAQVAKSLRRVAGELRCTMFVLTLTAFLLMLARRSRTGGTVVAVPVAGRAKPEFQDTVGFFVNTLPLRVDLSDDPEPGRAVERVRTAVLEALEHDMVPFDLLVDRLGVPRTPGCNPLVQVGFQLLPTPRRAGRVRWHDLEVGDWQGVSERVTRLDLELHLLDSAPEVIETLWCYRTDLFDAATAERLSADYQALLAEIGNG